MATYKVRCKVSYHSIALGLLDLFATAVRNGIFGNNPPFNSSPLTQAELQLLIDNNSNKYKDYKDHIGTRADFLLARKALMVGLDSLSDYVNTVAQNNPDIISLSGFIPTKSSNSQVIAPLRPEGVVIIRTNPGTFDTDCDPAAGVESYGALVSTQPLPENVIINQSGQVVITDDEPVPPIPPALAAGSGSIRFILDLNKGRKKKFTGLQIGVIYYLYYWAINAGGVSPMSEVVSKKVLEA